MPPPAAKENAPSKPAPPAAEARPAEKAKPPEAAGAGIAHIGSSVVIKGELCGSEDLYLDGHVEGGIELLHHCLIIGPNGRIRANLHAREIVVHGKVDGNLHASERVELKRPAVLTGDIRAKRITIEDGAYFKGSLDMMAEAPGEPEPAGSRSQPPAPGLLPEASASPRELSAVSSPPAAPSGAANS
jgi:cytoskeletal protein CcmA (bactofilin family)